MTDEERGKLLSAVARKFGDVLSRAERQTVAGIQP